MAYSRKDNRRYFVINFEGNSHNMRVSYLKLIPSLKIRKNSYYIGKFQMMVGCNDKYCDILLFELNKAMRNDGYVEFIEII